jgi:hypothetical protein
MTTSARRWITSGSTALRASAAWLRSERAYWLDLLVLGAVLAVVTIGIVVVFPQYYRDSAHYLGMSLWFTGTSQSDALAYVNHQNAIRGYDLNASVSSLFDWGLVKPRVMLSVLSVPFVLMFGPDGLAVTTILITVALVWVLYQMLRRRYGRVAAVAAVLMMLSSFLIMIFNIGMLTESLSALWGALALAAAWRYQNTRARRWVVVLIALTVLSGFTRQATFIVAGAFAIAWFMSLFVRAERGRWGVVALSVTATAAIVQIGQSLLFPTFSQLEQYMSMTGTTTLWDALRATPALVKTILVKEAHSYITNDQALIVILVLCLVSIVVFWRRPESHLLVGAILAIAVYNITNGNATDFRYAIPGLVFFLTSLALLISQIAKGLTAPRSADDVALRTPSSASTRS